MKRILALSAVVLTTAALAWAGSDSLSQAGSAVKPVITKAVKGEQCVEDTDYMRRNHMKVLDHHRDETVLKGIRTKKHSLKGCIDCHASEASGSVASAKEDFCVSCHTYAAVKIDCFECHSTKPQASITSHATQSGTHDYHPMAGQTSNQLGTNSMGGVTQ